MLKKQKHNLFLILLIPALISCGRDFSNSAKLTRYNTNDKDSFIFTLDEQFETTHLDSLPDDNHPKMTKAEVRLLNQFLVKQKFCLNQDGIPRFEVSSRQEKIYDITFSHLIEQNYKAKPVSPRTYFGRCLHDSN